MRMYCTCMVNIQVRDVSDDVHAALVTKAARAGQSLQQYLVGQLAVLATTPTLDDVLDRIEQAKTGKAGNSLTTREATEALEAERARR